ncbi:hypothetical protein NC653_027450 [Populus alba x Populus x berolinensis]|uniref:Uncharacterized protein n=1 Tax=Populus alba x Populus x berolinensis TaxID=444605 RepID=A0AAD6Q571_9ROSI|nr:hypothetical protein NC653_027450 [Populus alba x Populus x berolinensis]
MEATEALELFDSYWFGMETFKKQPILPKSSSLEANLDHENQEKALKPEISRLPATITRSMSEDLCSNTTFSFGFSFYSDSVLHAPKLHTIFSGEGFTEEEYSTPTEKKVTRRRGKKVKSKSLSELEYEELKGFTDLGFVFSEEDKDSKLASIIPGLQRLGKQHEDETVLDEPTVSRPYLSEAWEVQEQRMKEEPLMNWAIPALSNEIDMKDNLRWWAHTVASAAI